MPSAATTITHPDGTVVTVATDAAAPAAAASAEVPEIMYATPPSAAHTCGDTTDQLIS